jgi:hypothetical protein
LKILEVFTENILNREERQFIHQRIQNKIQLAKAVKNNKSTNKTLELDCNDDEVVVTSTSSNYLCVPIIHSDSLLLWTINDFGQELLGRLLD